MKWFVTSDHWLSPEHNFLWKWFSLRASIRRGCALMWNVCYFWSFGKYRTIIIVTAENQQKDTRERERKKVGEEIDKIDQICVWWHRFYLMCSFPAIASCHVRVNTFFLKFVFFCMDSEHIQTCVHIRFAMNYKYPMASIEPMCPFTFLILKLNSTCQKDLATECNDSDNQSNLWNYFDSGEP